MLARFFSVGVSVLALGLVVGCSNSTSDDGAVAGEDAVVAGEKAAAREVDGDVDQALGAASVTIKLRLKDTSIESLKAKVSDRDLGFWKSLKRPGELRIGKDSIKMGGSGGALFTDLKRDGDSVDAFMPFSESGLKRYAGLNFSFSYALKDTAEGFTLDVTNNEKVATKGLPVDVMNAKDLTFRLTATKAGNDVQVELQESVSILTAKDKVGKLLGCAVAVADALEAR